MPAFEELDAVDQEALLEFKEWLRRSDSNMPWDGDLLLACPYLARQEREAFKIIDGKLVA